MAAGQRKDSLAWLPNSHRRQRCWGSRGGSYLEFIYLTYHMMALLYETILAFEDTWIECLGDLDSRGWPLKMKASGIEKCRWDSQALVPERIVCQLGALLKRVQTSTTRHSFCRSGWPSVHKQEPRKSSTQRGIFFFAPSSCAQAKPQLFLRSSTNAGRFLSKSASHGNHDFFLASQHPSTSPAYNGELQIAMPALVLHQSIHSWTRRGTQLRQRNWNLINVKLGVFKDILSHQMIRLPSPNSSQRNTVKRTNLMSPTLNLEPPSSICPVWLPMILKPIVFIEWWPRVHHGSRHQPTQLCARNTFENTTRASPITSCKLCLWSAIFGAGKRCTRLSDSSAVVGRVGEAFRRRSSSTSSRSSARMSLFFSKIWWSENDEFKV